IYDDGVRRTNGLGDTYGPGPFTIQAASATELYVGSPFLRVYLDPDGVTGYEAFEGQVGRPDRIRLDRGLIFTRGGHVFNPVTLESLGYFPDSYLLEPELAQGR